jgi:acetyltransferase-like isoleucine patch superfamily enzyme
MRLKYSSVKSALASGKVYFTVRGEHRIKDDDDVVFINSCEIEPYTGFLSGSSLWSMGAFSYSWSSLPVESVVGRYCSIARGLKILGARHPLEWVSTSSFTYDPGFIIFRDLMESEQSQFKAKTRPVGNSVIHIGNDVWIGADVTLKPGISIGSGSVIAASSVVVKDVPPYSIVGGNPAKIIRQRFDTALVNKLLSSEWWKYKFTDFSAMNMEEPNSFVEQLKNDVSDGKVSRFEPIPVRLKRLAE